MHSLRAQAQARRRAAPELAREGLPSAHAGKTQNPAYRSCPMSDPPRACGENKLLLLARLLNGGSPPRVRGKPIPGEYDGKPTRITPAHAGKTCFTSGLHSPASDHPRACGENQENLAPCKTCSGSPPRMRGKLLFPAFRNLFLRITPAHAGKT